MAWPEGLVFTLGGVLFDHYKALSHIGTGHTIMFTICSVGVDDNENPGAEVQADYRFVIKP